MVFGHDKANLPVMPIFVRMLPIVTLHYFCPKEKENEIAIKIAIKLNQLQK